MVTAQQPEKFGSSCDGVQSPSAGGSPSFLRCHIGTRVSRYDVRAHQIRNAISLLYRGISSVFALARRPAFPAGHPPSLKALNASPKAQKVSVRQRERRWAHAGAIVLLAICSGILMTSNAYAQKVQYIKVPGGTPDANQLARHPALGNAPTPHSLSNTVSASVGNTDGVITNGTALGTLLRWPALPKYQYTGFQLMDGPNHNIAYYRDVFTALRYVAVGTHNGETWNVTANLTPSPTSSSVKTVVWPTVTYYTQLYGYPNCWDSPDWTTAICGVSEMQITAYRQSQCSQYGTWTFTLADDGNVVGTQSFTMRGSVPKEDLTLLSQRSTHSYDDICHTVGSNHVLHCDAASPPPGEIPFTIREVGCALTATDMVLAYHGFGTDVNTFDDELVALKANGFNKVGDVKWNFSHTLTDGQVNFIGSTGVDIKAVKKAICTYGPQVMGTKITYNSKGHPQIGHWVMVVGRTKDDKSWKIYDPGDTVNGPRNLTSAYGGVYAAVREYAGTTATYHFPLNQFNVSLYCPAELLVTNPAGKRTGYDPVTNKSYSEIPNALYVTEGMDNDVTGAIDPDPTKIFTSGAGAPQGTYKLQVTGTGTGTYTLITTRIGTDGGTLGVQRLSDIPITNGEVNTYSVDYSTSSTNPIVFRGGFCGRSNNPDVNKFLCYGNPGQARTTLPAGTMKFRLMISYGPTTTADTFSALLDGEDITSLFNPAPGKTETVYVPLPVGSSRNTLVLSISGTKPTGRTATDTDRLVFLTK